VIDLHAHVLPGIDDGPATMPEAVAVAAAAWQDGVTVLAATPHVRPDHPAVRPSELAARTAELNAACAAAGVTPTLVSGGEVDLAWAQDAADDDLVAVSYGGRGHDLLVETPYGELPAGFEELLFRVSARGFRVLLAHPERNPSLQRTPQRVRALVERGVLLQVTAAALTSTNRRSRSRRLARELVREGVAHVIASDRHGPDLARSSLSDGITAATRDAGMLRAMWMATEAPAAILDGDPLPPPPASRRRWRLAPRRG
jgi:protein-tyrosine phosphatase